MTGRDENDDMKTRSVPADLRPRAHVGEGRDADAPTEKLGNASGSPEHSRSAFASGESFPPGTMLASRYRVVARLGSGGMGAVYRADDLTLNQPVALKFLPPEFAGDPRRIDRLRQEVRVGRDVSHPAVCRIYDIGEHKTPSGPRHFITMEYIDGEDLCSLLRRIGALPREKALQIVRQVCAGARRRT
jgi:serine/threonine protein kinase